MLFCAFFGSSLPEAVPMIFWYGPTLPNAVPPKVGFSLGSVAAVVALMVRVVMPVAAVAPPPEELPELLEPPPELELLELELLELLLLLLSLPHPAAVMIRPNAAPASTSIPARFERGVSAAFMFSPPACLLVKGVCYALAFFNSCRISR
jgi:hypothetical protein